MKNKRKRLSNILVAVIVGVSITLAMLPYRILEYLNPGDDFLTQTIIDSYGLLGAIINRVVVNVVFFTVIAFIVLSIFRRNRPGRNSKSTDEN